MQEAGNQLRETFIQELKDLYDAEKQLTKALPKMAKAAQHEELRQALESHLQETEEQVHRLEQVFEMFDEPAKAKKCVGIRGIIEEGEDIISEEQGDAALICGAQKAEHYEIATYGSLIAWAKLMGENEAANLLTQTLEEEKQADEKLTEIAESAANPQEAQHESAD